MNKIINCLGTGFAGCPNEFLAAQLVLLGIVGYGVFVFALRWFLSARPMRRGIEERTRQVRARLPLVSPPNTTATTEIQKLLDRAKELADWPPWVFIWSKGDEVASWRLIHEAETLMADLYSPEEVKVRLVMVANDLHVTGNPTADAMAEYIASKIGIKLGTQAPIISNPLSPEWDVAKITDGWALIKPALSVDEREQRALLKQGMRKLYEQRDRVFADAMDWNNRSLWLLIVALALIAVLGIFVGGRSLLVLGALGGLLSRLTRTFKRQQQLSDDGTQWMAIFLSPVLGALVGWAGVLILSYGRNLFNLDILFSGLVWDAPLNVTKMALAIVFGISERLFDSVTSFVDQRFVSTLDKPAR